jgi:hypothetical protein
MTTINLGNLKFTWKGAWQASTLYNKDDIVKYGASAYVCTDSHTSDSTFAANSSRFDLMVEGITNAGAWNSSTLYQLNEVVTYGGAVYIALQENANLNPYDEPGYWQKFVDGQQFEGYYDNLLSYQPGDIVEYGGYIYVAKDNSQGNLPTDTLFWDVMVKGYRERGTYNSGQLYLPGDVVDFGGNKYVVKEGQPSTGTQPNNSSIVWQKILEGFNWRGEYSNTNIYYPNDVVKRGANLYLCTDESTGNLPETSNFNFELFLETIVWKGTYSSSSNYVVGDIVIFGGTTYICIESYEFDGSTIIEPSNNTYWARFTSGMNWLGTWQPGDVYKLDDVVEYAQSSYISRIHNNTGNQPDLDDGTNWQLVAQGDSNAVVAQTGDLLYRSALQAERLPIGPSGSVLTSNGSIPVWGHLAPQNDYYVSTQGDDSNDGRTSTTSWRTIKHACEQTFNLGQVRINVHAGLYEEQCPIRVGRSVVLEGNGLGAVTVSPDNTNDNGFGVGISDDGSTPNANSYVFHMNNGARIRNLVFRNFSTGSVMVSLDPGTGPDDTSVWITSQSPYVQNCTSFTPGGTGFKIDGALHNGGYKSMVANDWTQINSDGIGIHALNDGRTEIVSCFTYYCAIGYLAESGAKIRAIVGNNSYGEYGAVARGYSQSETPLSGNLRLDTATINSVQQLSSNVHVFTSYRDSVGNRFFVGHTDPTGTDVTSTFDNTASVPIVAKFNSAGSLDWIYTYTSSFGAIHSAIELSDVIFCGGTLYDGGTNKGFILAISKAGEIQWQRTIGDTSEIVDLTTDGNNLYAIGSHVTAGVSVIKLNPAGIEQFSSTIEYANGSGTSLTPKSCTFAATPTTSVDTYALAGDATAENNLYVASYDTTANEAVITRIDQLGNLVTSYTYGDININKLRLDTGNGDGIYLMIAGSYDDAGTLRPLLARLSVDGTVQWQKVFEDGSNPGEYKDVLPFGNDVYASGYITIGGVNQGLLTRFTSNGNSSWDRVISNSTNNIALNGVMLDGVNVVSAGIDNGNSVITSIQRDLTNGLGTVTSGSYQLDTNAGFYTANTLLVKSAHTAEYNNVALGSTETTLTLDQQPTQTRTIAATRAGFAGIGTGVVFSVDGLTRRPKEGSVLQIAGDSETYFVIGVDNYIANAGVFADNNPNAVSALTNNKTWIQEETIGWIDDQIANANAGSIWDGFTYNSTTCKRDVGLIVDALITDLDSSVLGSIEQNDSSVDAAREYWNGSSSVISGEIDQTVAAINYMNGLVANAMDKTSPAQTYSVETQNTSHSTVETGSTTFATDRVTIIADVVENGLNNLPVATGTGSGSIQVDPAIPSNKTPDDNTQLVFREAFSQVRMSGHDFLDIGTGGFADTNYPVIIAEDYTQQPNQNRETLAESGGRVFYVTTDQNGNFRVGDYFKVEQATGRATLSSEEFDLAGLNELQLGSITAGKQGATINEFSTDGTFADNSDSAVPTEKAVKTYVDIQIDNLSATQGTIVAGDDPTQSKVEVTGTGATSDTINIDIAGALIAQLAQQYMLVPKGTTGARPNPAYSGYFRFNTDTNTFEGYDGTQWSGVGGGNPWITATTNTTVSNNDRVFVDSSSTALTITLPATPNTGDRVQFIDVAGNALTNNITIGRNGENIMGLAQDMVIDEDNAGFALIYSGATYGWVLEEV